MIATSFICSECNRILMSMEQVFHSVPDESSRNDVTDANTSQSQSVRLLITIYQPSLLFVQ